MSTLPYREEVVNRNKYGEYDMYTRDKFIGMFMPNGEIFQCKSGHGFGASRTSLQYFFNYPLKSLSQEQCIEHLEQLKKKRQNIMQHKDKLFLIPLLEWEIDYAKNHFDLDSRFMKEYVGLCEDKQRGGYWDTADYVTQLLHFDKVERLPKTITTSRINIYEAFYNYLLMDFNIVRIPGVVFNEDIGDFCYHMLNEFVTVGKERELEDEIQLIKKYVPITERDKYFR